MADEQSIERGELLALTTEIVSAHVGNNGVGAADLPALIQTVFDTLSRLGSNEPATVGRTDAGGADQALGDRRLHRLP